VDQPRRAPFRDLAPAVILGRCTGIGVAREALHRAEVGARVQEVADDGPA